MCVLVFKHYSQNRKSEIIVSNESINLIELIQIRKVDLVFKVP